MALPKDPTTAKQTGRLSIGDQDFILANVDTMGIKKVAEHLNRTVDPIVKFINNHKLAKALPDRSELATYLRMRPYWPELEEQLNEVELRLFERLWIEVLEQFHRDVLPTEELQIKQYIIMEILMNRSMKERKRCLIQMEEVDAEMKRALASQNRDQQRLDAMNNSLMYLRNAVAGYTTEHMKLSGDIQKIGKDLKATRDQRIQRIEGSKDSFTSWLKMLEKEDTRSLVGRDLAIKNIAKEKFKKELSEYHKFVDGEVDRPFLTPEVLESVENE